MNQCVQAAALGEVFGETTIAETTRFGMMEESKEQIERLNCRAENGGGHLIEQRLKLMITSHGPTALRSFINRIHGKSRC
jgi:hypothetical protein